MIKDFKIIPLETNDNCLIKQVKSIKSYNDDWYIQDFADVPVKVFSKDGKSVSEIGHKGGGPGEFLHFADFIVDKGAVHIFGWSGNRKWIRYSNSNQFLFETAMSFPFDHICKIDNNNYLAYVGHGTVFDESSYYLVSVHKI
ncbi:hypothetical protein FACS189464_1150 [Bacteroidia bacterium]|nr:hypothetical protein FACS189464_1150 [Bacteroidia bacterium]